MKSILKQARAKNVEKLYNIQDINSNGVVSVQNKKIIIHKVEPANIIACDENVKQKIYQAYVTCIRGMPDVFQIVISNSKETFETQIEYYKKRLLRINNNGLKQALTRYINSLEKLSKQSEFNKTTHYLIVEENFETEVTNAFSNLEQLGVVIKRIKSKNEVERVLRASVIKEGSEQCG